MQFPGDPGSLATRVLLPPKVWVALNYGSDTKVQGRRVSCDQLLSEMEQRGWRTGELECPARMGGRPVSPVTKPAPRLASLPEPPEEPLNFLNGWEKLPD